MPVILVWTVQKPRTFGRSLHVHCLVDSSRLTDTYSIKLHGFQSEGPEHTSMQSHYQYQNVAQ